VSLIEVMASLLIIIVGLAGLFMALVSAIRGGASASRLAQAQARAESLLEAMRRASPQTLACLSATAPAGWSACELTCATTMTDGGVASPQACVLTVDSLTLVPGPPAGASGATGQGMDRSGQQYALYASPADPARSTFVRATGPGDRVFDVQVAIAWNDDGTASATAAEHVLALRTGFFR
jgi:type II secretory pathway pseudopilin PulG